MKKSLLILVAIAFGSGVFAQTVPNNWSAQNVAFPTSYMTSHFLEVVDANTVWGIAYYADPLYRPSNYYFRTTNGGTAWTTGTILATDTNQYTISNIHAIDANNAWCAFFEKPGQKGVLYKTTDGGATWVNGGNGTMFTNATSFANWVVFVTPSVGVCQGDYNPSSANNHEIWRTTDAGASWTLVPSSNIPMPFGGDEYGLTDSYTYLGNTIWFGTNKGRVYRSTDAGVTWSVGATGATGEVTDLAFTDQSNGLCIGRSGTVTRLYSTTDGGQTWTNLNQPINLGTWDISAIPGTSWFASATALGSGWSASTTSTLSYSTDHGVTWNLWGGTGMHYMSVAFTNNSKGWAGTMSDVAGQGGIITFTGTALGVSQDNYVPKAISAYPNPSNGIVNIMVPTAKKGMDLVVTNALGGVVYNEKILTTTLTPKQLNLQHLPKGIYFLNMNNGSEKYFQKIIIE